MALQINGTTVVDDSRNFFGSSNCSFFVNTLATSTQGHNNFIGDNAGRCVSTGSYNTFIGDNAGCGFTVGSFNIAIGRSSAKGCGGSSGSHNVFLGSYSGCRAVLGGCNVYIGHSAGRCILNGCYNNFIGFYSGRNNSGGNYNNLLGFRVGCSSTFNGSYNNFMGYYAGQCSSTGNRNVYIGMRAGRLGTTASCNVSIGYYAGCVNQTGSNNIFINNTGSNVSNQTCIGNTGTVTTYTFGNFVSEGNVTAYSDESLKENIERIQNALEKVRSLEGVTYNRNDYPDKPRHMGLIAQCVEKVIPEVIGEADGKLTVAYGNLIALVVEAIKEIDERLEILEGK